MANGKTPAPVIPIPKAPVPIPVPVFPSLWKVFLAAVAGGAAIAFSYGVGSNWHRRRNRFEDDERQDSELVDKAQKLLCPPNDEYDGDDYDDSYEDDE